MAGGTCGPKVSVNVSSACELAPAPPRCGGGGALRCALCEIAEVAEVAELMPITRMQSSRGSRGPLQGCGFSPHAWMHGAADSDAQGCTPGHTGLQPLANRDAPP